MEIKNAYDSYGQHWNNNIINLSKQVKNSKLPKDKKQELLYDFLSIKEESWNKKKEVIDIYSSKMKEKIAKRLHIPSDMVDWNLINWLKNIPKNRDKVSKNISNAIKHNNLIINPTVFINLKLSNTDVNDHNKYKNDGGVWDIYSYLWNPNYTIYNTSVFEKQINNVNNTLNILTNSPDYNNFINNLKNNSELDSLLEEKKDSKIVAERLQALSFIADTNLYNSKMFAQSLSTERDAANNALKRKYSPNDYYSILKKSLTEHKHINATTCIQLHTFIAKAWEDMGYGEWITSTVDIWVSHRLAILKVKNTNKMYLISDGLMLEGNSYKQLVSLLPWRFVLTHYLYNSDNKQIWTVQTDTEKRVSKNLNAYNFNSVSDLGTQQFIWKVLFKNNLDYLHRKNVLKAELWNNDKSVISQHTFDNGTFLFWKITDNKIPTEGNNVESGSVWAWIWNSNVDMRMNIWTQQIERTTLVGTIKEQIYNFHTAILVATDKHYFANWFYSKASWYWDVSMVFENNGVPITNAQWNIWGGLMIWKKFSNNSEIYIKWEKTYRIESATSLNSNTQIFKPTFVDGWYNVTIWWKTDVDNVKVWWRMSYHKELLTDTKKINLNIWTSSLYANLSASKTSYDTSILPDETKLKLQVEKKINTTWSIYWWIEHRQEGNTINSNKVYGWVKIEF